MIKTEQKVKNYKNKNEYRCNIVGNSNHATQRAITLIALVITIIVLLILAGVTINLVLGPEGLIKQAQDATDRYKQAEENEINSISNLVAQLEAINNGNGSETPTDPEKPKAGDVIKTEDNIKYTSDGEENVIPVPVGFTYAGVGTKETGFVIRNEEDLNEFVWIPTDLIEYKIYDWNSGVTATRFTEYYTSNTTENTKIVNEITKSVSDNKGYYISRYEAGLLTKRTSRPETTLEELPRPIFRATSSSTPVYGYGCVTWDDAIYLGDSLYNKEENNITSRLINARGWSTALKFIETIGEDKDALYSTSPSGKGWFNDNFSSNNSYEIGKSVDLTNSTIPNKLKNIYDMAGNMSEWTADKDTSYSTNRARRNSIGDPSKYPTGNISTMTVGSTAPGAGFRLALYL